MDKVKATEEAVTQKLKILHDLIEKMIEVLHEDNKNKKLQTRMSFPGQGFPSQAFPGRALPGFWPYCGNFGPVTTPVVDPQTVTSSLSVPAPHVAVSSSCSNKANKSSSLVISHPEDHSYESDQEDSDEEERFSVAPDSQEGGFSSDEEGDTPVQDSQNVSQHSVPASIPSSSEIVWSSTNFSKDPEAKDTPSFLKDLRDSVYTIMRNVNKVLFQSPPRPRSFTSTFEACCGLSEDHIKPHTSFPQSNHMSTSLQIIND
ncbi:unnamed protein product [Mytilus coruscus]|uniref:Uncharacterized protein n=1 Tax=Mytilus coruscus TaxID=42192 RepID=A0A6J8F067_MYTCO|nr:unnamed protein product [Mytilus coruscus]